jgi:serine acetyltransferase
MGGSGVKSIGDVHVGDHSEVGANAVHKDGAWGLTGT